MADAVVTIFALYLDNFIVTLYFSFICQIRDFGSGQIQQPRQIYLSPVPMAIGIAKIAPWWLPTFTPSTAGPLYLSHSALCESYLHFDGLNITL
jgi:hypothetical protein